MENKNKKVVYVAISENNALGSFSTLKKASNYLISIGFTKKDPNNSNRFVFYASSDLFAEVQTTKLNIVQKRNI